MGYSINHKLIYPNIRMAINKFRDDKLNKLNEKEAMNEEVGKEIKKYREIHNILRLKGVAFDREKYLNNINKQYKNKVKENGSFNDKKFLVFVDKKMEYEDDYEV